MRASSINVSELARMAGSYKLQAPSFFNAPP